VSDFYRHYIHPHLPWQFRIWWDLLWIRKDEFHECYTGDIDAMLRMTNEECIEYRHQLQINRNLAGGHL
jgi:hypothetical protein